MKTNLDLKSVCFGIMFGILATLATGAVIPNSGGRYEVGGTSNWGLVLDTTTGKVWRTYLNPTGGGVDSNFFDSKNPAEK